MENDIFGMLVGSYAAAEQSQHRIAVHHTRLAQHDDGNRDLAPFLVRAGDDGSLGSWLGSLFSALADGDPAIWFFTLTPLIAIAILRLGWALFRRK